MKKILALSFVMLFCFSAVVVAASRTADTITSSIAVKDVKTLYDAIIKGCGDRGWVPQKSGENEITATLDTRGHQVVVRIPYSEKGYEIIYKDSKKMNYNPKNNGIHAKYNQWTANLDRSIKENINFTKELE